MNYTLEKLENSQVKFTIDIDSNELEMAIEEAYQKSKHKYSLEGFRKGKVPRKVLESTYGKGVFIDDALDIILPKYFSEALDKEPEVEPVGRPEADILDMTEESLQFAVTITVKPEVKLGKYKGLKLEKEKVEVTDEQLEAELKLAQDKQSRIVDVEEEREAVMGDIVNINFSGSVDGVKFEGGTGEEYDLEIGSNTFIPGFEEQVVGMKKGEEKDVIVTFPEEYGADNLAGKEAVFAVKANAIKAKELPALDDEFAKDISEFDTFDEYKADLKNNLIKQAEEQAKVTEENKMVDAIVENSTVEVPDCMVEEQAEEMIKEFEYRLMYQGMKLDDYFKFTGLTREKLAEDYKESALMTVKTRLVLEAIIKELDIKPDEEAVEKQLAEMAENANKTVEEFKKDMNQRYISYLLNQNLSDQLMVMLKEMNTFK